MTAAKRYAPVRFKRDGLVHRSADCTYLAVAVCDRINYRDSPEGDVAAWFGAGGDAELCPVCDQACIPAGFTAADAKRMCGFLQTRTFRRHIEQLAAQHGISATLPEGQWIDNETPLFDEDLVRELAAATHAERATWWGIKEVAEYLQVSESTVRGYDARGQMPPAQGQRGRPTWQPESIRRWNENRPGKGNRTPRKPSAEG